MYQLNNLSTTVKRRKRVGRGGARGGTAGKGSKGQKARSGGMHGRRDFEGGQMPLVRRLPKRGFNNANFAITYEIVNIEQLEKTFEPNSTVNKQQLIEKGLLRKNAVRIKVLGKGTLTKKLNVQVDAISEAASQAIKALGGQVILAGE